MNLKELNYKKITLLLTYLTILIAVIFNIQHVLEFIKSLFTIISPVIMGIVLAFLFNILMVKYEKLFFKKDLKNEKPITGLKRIASISATLLTVFIILALIFMLLIPELFSSMKVLIDNIGNYTEEIKAFGQKVIEENNIFESAYKEFMSTWMDTSKSLGQWFVGASSNILTTTISIFGSIFNFVLGIVFSIYLLYQKEPILLNVKKTLYAYLPKKKADKISSISNITIKTFTNFVSGQVTEAIILGTLCTLGMLLLKMPYAILIGVVVGVTSLIPIFGAYLGAIPSAFLLLMEDPILAIIFIVFLIILQQIEGNIIYPKVVGKSVGLTGFWILLAVVIGSSLAGVAGVLIGVPLCSVIYYLLRDDVNKRIKQKKLKIK